MRHPDALVIDLREAEIFYRYLANPNLLKELVSDLPEGHTIVIDEIQKIPDLLSIVHLLIEKKRKWKFILTGSSSRKLRRQGVDLMAGRALNMTLHPFMAAELQDEFDLEEALMFGLLPMRFSTSKPWSKLKSYITLYMEEELKTEGIVRNLEPFARFLSVMSLSHGCIINVTNIAQECFVKRPTVVSWLSVLQELLLSYTLPIFEQRAKRELSSHPKFYFFDTGIYRALRPQFIKDPAEELDGPGLEGLVLQHLMAWRDYTEQDHSISFWRTRSGVEVDFIVLGALGFWAIEVKNSKTIRPADIRSLRSFQEDYPEVRTLFLYRGKDRLIKNNVLCIPIEDFLKMLLPNKPLDHAFPVRKEVK